MHSISVKLVFLSLFYFSVVNTLDAQDAPPPPPPADAPSAPAPPPPPPPPVLKQDRDVYKVVEEMPRFPGCEDSGLKGKELYKCSNEKLLEYVQNNLVYPEEAKKSGIEGKVVVQFIVEKDGSITEAKVIKDIGSNCGQAVKDVILSMNEMSDSFIPGKQRGKAVAVLYTLPVMFALPGSDK